jgi:hypothetical protein
MRPIHCVRTLATTLLSRDMTTATTVYGIPNCDTVKRARAAVAAAGLECEFHDFKLLRCG